ncbi:MAG: AsmA-like C-terminal domain-containing protein [Mariprofundales bacterium]
MLALVLALIVLPVVFFLYLAPSADTLQPQLEQMVAKQIGLGEVKLGKLSWHWSGWLWLHSDDFQMATSDRTIQFRHAAIDIRLALSDLLHGDITPRSLRFHGGTMEIDHHFLDAPIISLPPIGYRFENLTVHWIAPKMEHDFKLTTLAFDIGGGQLDLEMENISMHGLLRPDLLPQRVVIQWNNLHWLPAKWLQPFVDGDSRGEVTLEALGRLRWKLSGSSDSNGDPIVLRLGSGIYPTNHVDGVAIAIWDQSGDSPWSLDALQLKQAHWQLGNQHIYADGNWQAGVATMHAHAPLLTMELIWSWLRPLGTDKWHKWLKTMQLGKAVTARTSVTLPWRSPLSTLPDWSHMRYKVSTQLKEGEIALGLDGDRLSDVSGTLHLDEKRLWAKVDAATLPHHLGAISGTLTLPWDSLELAIHGQGATDLQQILRWQGVKEQVRWQQSKATANFDLRWKVSDTKPNLAKVIVRPASEWRLTFSGIHARMEEGFLQWKPGSLTMHEMTFHIGKMGGGCQATLKKSGEKWALTNFTARARVDLTNAATIAKPFVRHPHGELQLTLHFDGSWHGMLNADEASWSNLLGSVKKAGDPLQVTLGEIAFTPDDHDSWSVRGINSKGKVLTLRDARIGHRQQRLWVDIPQLRSPTLDGAFHFTLPDSLLDPAQARFTIASLDRETLRPLVDSWRHRKAKRAWLVNGSIARFRWGDNLQAEQITVRRDASGSNQVTVANMDVEQNHIRDLNSRFTLAPDHINVDELHATIGKQQLLMSASLRKGDNHAWLWSGFAALDGSFGGLMKQMKLSRLFAEGTIHALFNGRGELKHHQPWWQSLQGRLRLRVDDGRILQSGTLTRLLAATSLVDLPKFLMGKRKDLTGDGMLFRHLQLEGQMNQGEIDIHRLALRSSAMDVAGIGTLDIGKDLADVYLVARPFQNLDAIISSVPLLRDILGGPAHSLFRKIYHLYGPLNDAHIEPSTPRQAGIKSAGVIDTLLNLPTLWFGEKTP